MRAFTLIEMVVVIAIVAGVSGAILSVIRDFYRTNAYVLESANSVDSARRGIATALQDIREASYADDGNYPIATVSTSSITFYSDVDRDGGVEKVRIYLSSGTLYKGITNAAGNPPSYTGQSEASSTIATYVRNTTANPLFTYYDSSGVQLATTSTNIANIAAVNMSLDVDLNPNRAPNLFNLSGSATLRNLNTE